MLPQFIVTEGNSFHVIKDHNIWKVTESLFAAKGHNIWEVTVHRIPGNPEYVVINRN